MKKNVKTLMTAAMFAAAMGNLPTGTSTATAYSPEDEAMQDTYGPPPIVTTIAETTTVQPVYGTVPYWTTTPTTDYNPHETETTLAAVYGPPFWTTETTTVSEEPIPVPVYGPPFWTTETTTVSEEPIPVPVYGPPLAWKGDLDSDNRIDVFDMIEMRRKYLEAVLYGKYDDRADINEDGEVNIADMVMLQKYILGGIKDFSDQMPEPVETTTNKSRTIKTTKTTVVQENNEEN